ncbi:hypothetical protein AXW83_13010 [Bosea sp. PAMC 26642]|nr:hypothetical protein [Bosea sp. PAMC 26642]AMJ61087.1 hypothetical protein AXW83_13010 [Bosea sp. PAMC 26642]
MSQPSSKPSEHQRKVGLIDCDVAIVTTRLDAAGMALQEQTVGLHETPNLGVHETGSRPELSQRER